ncbi:MAG: hypothetical protein JWM47_1793 [Acidimicrobiales bacterium]|nr:hypothetical protein [Acidimicrobiales bacterium]
MALPEISRPTSTLAALVLATALMVGGCTKGDGPDAGKTDGSTTTSAKAATDPALVVQTLVIADDDLRDGERTDLMEGGTLTTGSVTLDFCGYPFTTEDDRTARRQEVISTTAEDYVGSNEAVFYRPGQAATAIDEVRQAIAACPKDEAVGSKVEGVAEMVYATTPVAADDLDGLADDHVAVNVVATPTGGDALERTFIYQRRGDVLMASYAIDPARAIALAEAAAARLAAMPPADVGA